MSVESGYYTTRLKADDGYNNLIDAKDTLIKEDGVYTKFVEFIEDFKEVEGNIIEEQREALEHIETELRMVKETAEDTIDKMEANAQKMDAKLQEWLDKQDQELVGFPVGTDGNQTHKKVQSVQPVLS